MKGVGKPRYYLGGDVLELDESWHKEGIYHAFSAETYITNAIPKLAKLVGLERFAKKDTPMDPKYYPELDDSPLLEPEDISKYRSLIGSLNWILTLGRFDIAYALSSMSRYNMAPREGHMKAVHRILGYLAKHDKGHIVIDDGHPNVQDKANISTGYDWSEYYPDVEEEIPTNMPIT